MVPCFLKGLPEYSAPWTVTFDAGIRQPSCPPDQPFWIGVSELRQDTGMRNTLILTLAMEPLGLKAV
jgi:hypothetical protein